MSRPTFYNAKIMQNNRWKSQNVKITFKKMFFYDLKMHFSYKNITFVHENLSHLIKCSLCVLIRPNIYSENILIGEKLFYM